MQRIATRVVFPIAFFAAAIFHVAAMVWPSLAPGASPSRHAAFVVINFACALGFSRATLRRSRAFVIAFALLVVQQLWSHGNDLIASARDGRIDATSIGVVIAMPLALWLLVRDGSQ